VIINLAPGDPVTVTEISQEGLAGRKEDRAVAFGSDDRYLLFREHYGLTLPIIINLWPYTSEEKVRKTLWRLAYRKEDTHALRDISSKDYNNLRISFGDRSKYIMSVLFKVIDDENEDLKVREYAVKFFVRGGTRQGYVGQHLNQQQKDYNRRVAKENDLLRSFLLFKPGEKSNLTALLPKITEWYNNNRDLYLFEPTFGQKIKMMFETRFIRYISRVLTLDFGTLRNDDTKTVTSEVTKRFKYSLTLALLPMFLTFFISQSFGVAMAYFQNRWPDWTFNVFFLILYAVPVFVVAPFLIEKIALNHDFPFTHTPIPISGFTSPDNIYDKMTSSERLLDIATHIFLPLIAIIYGSLASSARLSRTAVLEVMRQDYVRTAKAKGVSTGALLFKHVGRNASITIVTSLAGSLGIVLGGSLIVETLFEINGFGKFFYDSVINRDYNVIMFSAIAGSVLTLLGYLVADIAYTFLDPRITLE
jgi:peptide/nickel transport system permease protein